MQELTKIGFAMDEQGYYTTRLVDDNEVLRLSAHILEQRLVRGPRLESPAGTRNYLIHRAAHLKHEVFGMIWLDNRHRVLAIDEIFRGSINGVAVYVREVVRQALLHNAAAAIAWHNHPSGDPEPSRSDQDITEKLKSGLSLIDVRLLDHIVAGVEGTVSFSERGLL